MSDPSAEQELRQLEESLLNPVLRSDPQVLGELLADDFREFGSSGCVYTKADAMAALLSESRGQISITDFNVQDLCSGAALLTYRALAERGRAASLRSSVWVRREGAWRIVFHQGTPAPD